MFNDNIPIPEIKTEKGLYEGKGESNYEDGMSDARSDGNMVEQTDWKVGEKSDFIIRSGKEADGFDPLIKNVKAAPEVPSDVQVPFDSLRDTYMPGSGNRSGWIPDFFYNSAIWANDVFEHILFFILH